MSFVATAIIGSAVIGAGGSAIAGNQAAKATEGATNASIAEQNLTLGQQQVANAPYENLGSAALPQYQALLGIGPNGQPASAAQQAGVQSALAATPGYQFTLGQGTTNTVNQASAMGLGLSGNTLEGLDTFSAGLADQTYQNAVGNAQGAVGMGQAAAAGQASNIGAAGSNISNALLQQGQTTAGIDANTIAGLTKATGGATSNFITANTLAGLSNPSFTANDINALNAGNSGTMNIGGGYLVNSPGAIQ
jgi:hypothetical protein